MNFKIYSLNRNKCKMKLTIDEKMCLKHKMTIEEFLIAYMYGHVKKPDQVLQNLLNREILVLKNGDYYLTQRWNDVMNEIIADSTQEQDEERLKNLAIQMRDLYPAGRIIDRKTGQPTSYYFKCNVSEIMKKLKTFFIRFGNFSDEDILDATKRYVASFRGNYQQKGFRIIKYFIWKDDVKVGPDGNYVESISPLLDFLENKESEEEVVVGTNSDDWMTKMI